MEQKSYDPVINAPSPRSISLTKDMAEPWSSQFTVLDLKVADLECFLREQQEGYPDIQMICPFLEVPLPYIHLGFGEPDRSVKIEFSPILSMNFIQFVMKWKSDAQMSFI